MRERNPEAPGCSVPRGRELSEGERFNHHYPFSTVYVLDTSVILTYSGALGVLLEEGVALPPSVLDEVQLEPQRSRLQELIEAGARVLHPGEEALRAVREAARGAGEHHLSEADVDVLALALQLGATLFTEDYSMQNVAQILGIPWRSLTTRGIRKVYLWGFKCVDCGRVFEEAPGESCPVCGGRLRRWRLKTKGKLNFNKGLHRS